MLQELSIPICFSFISNCVYTCNSQGVRVWTFGLVNSCSNEYLNLRLCFCQFSFSVYPHQPCTSCISLVPRVPCVSHWTHWSWIFCVCVYFLFLDLPQPAPSLCCQLFVHWTCTLLLKLAFSFLWHLHHIPTYCLKSSLISISLSITCFRLSNLGWMRNQMQSK